MKEYRRAIAFAIAAVLLAILALALFSAAQALVDCCMSASTHAPVPVASPVPQPPTATQPGPVTLPEPVKVQTDPAICKGLTFTEIRAPETQGNGPTISIVVMGYSPNGNSYIGVNRTEASRSMISEVYVLSAPQKPLYLSLDPMVFGVPPGERVCVRSYFVRFGRTPVPGGKERVESIPISNTTLTGFVVPARPK